MNDEQGVYSMATYGVTTTLAKFFGYHPVSKDPEAVGMAKGGIKGFSAELKALSKEEKLDMTRAAAKEMNFEQKDVSFDLT